MFLNFVISAFTSTFVLAMDTVSAIAAIEIAGVDSNSVGGAVVVLIAGLIVFSIVFGLMRKA